MEIQYLETEPPSAISGAINPENIGQERQPGESRRKSPQDLSDEESVVCTKVKDRLQVLDIAKTSPCLPANNSHPSNNSSIISDLRGLARNPSDIFG